MENDHIKESVKKTNTGWRDVQHEFFIQLNNYLPRILQVYLPRIY